MDSVYDLMAAGRYKEALRVWNQPGQKQGGHIHYNNGAKLHLLLRDYEGARQCFETSAAIGPKVRSTYHAEGCALSLWLVGDKQGAISLQRQVVGDLDAGKIEYASDPDGLWERLRLVALHALDSQFDAARRIVDTLEQVEPDTSVRARQTVRFLKSQCASAEFLTKARLGADGEVLAETRAKRPMCVAEFYVGISLLINRDPQRAKTFFKKAAARHAILENEWYLAREAAEAGVSHG